VTDRRQTDRRTTLRRCVGTGGITFAARQIPPENVRELTGLFTLMKNLIHNSENVLSK